MSVTASEYIVEIEEVIVRAGAGAGKTTELVRRVLGLAQTKRPFPRLLVTTFTRKATEELRERLLKKAMDSEADEALLQYLTKSSSLHISTIHGVLHKFLSQFGAAIDLPPVFRFISENEELRLIKKCLREESQRNPIFLDHLGQLTDNFEFKVLVTALRDSVNHRFSFPQVSLVSLEDLNSERDHIKIQTRRIATDIVELLKNEALTKNWQIFLDEVKRCLAESNWQDFKRPRLVPTKSLPAMAMDLKEQLDDLVSHLSDWSLNDEFFNLHQHLGESFQFISYRLLDLLFAKKIQSACLTMTDLENFSLKLLREYPELGAQFAEQWDYWLIDEYQDTSPRQVSLIRQLKGSCPSFTVGDPQQSIYLFRGARSEVFLEKESENRKSGGKTASLQTNYRSRKEVLLYLNHVFTGLGEQFVEMEVGSTRSEATQPAAIYMRPPEGKEFDFSWELQTCLFRCQELLNQGVAPEKICVLARTNSELEQLAQGARSIGLPFQVHAASKFFARREIRDALALLRFLINPKDNVNLLELLRSPYFRIEDSWLAEIAALGPSDYWTQVKQLEAYPVVESLKSLLSRVKELGVYQVFCEGLVKNGYFDLSHRIDPSGRREANLWKLLTMLKQAEKQSGFSYFSWLQKYSEKVVSLEGSEGDADAVPVLEPNRIHFMTVHASKGLEFDHVIIFGLGRYRPRADASLFMGNEDSGQWSLALYRPQDAKRVTSLLANKWAKQKKEREQKEYERVLYVAMSRAKESLSLIWAREDRDSWAARIWQPQEGLDLPFQAIVRRGEFLPSSQELVEDGGLDLPPKWQGSVSAKPRRLGVSQLLNKQEGPRPYRSSGSNRVSMVKKAALGIQSHRCFEAIKYGRSPEPSLKKAYDFFESWNKGLLIKLIHQGQVEWGFCVRDAGLDIQGQIDLWAVFEDELWVIDYKTGSSEYVEKAFEQLEIYAWALQKMHPELASKPKHLAAVFPSEEKVLLAERSEARVPSAALAARA